MATPVQRVIANAAAEIGYLEKRSNANLNDKTANAGYNNWNKYADELDKIGTIFNGPKNGYDWCACFVVWNFVKTFGVDNAMKMLYLPYKGTGASCTFAMGFYKKNGRFSKTPQPGDQIFFTDDGGNSAYHTGLVSDVKGNTVYTVEGNTSSSSAVVANGGCVAQKSYPANASYIAGYGHPNFSIIPATTTPKPTPKPVEKPKEEEEVRYNKVSEMPKWAQEKIQNLVDNGYIAGSGKKDSNGQPIDLDLSMDMIRTFVVISNTGIFKDKK